MEELGHIESNGILLLSNNSNAQPLYEWLNQIERGVTIYRGKLTSELILDRRPRFIISYNYSYIIEREVIELIGNKGINLHISYLPWNRGASPNFWSFIDDTPKGVTIHRLAAGLDKGAILLQKSAEFDEENETFLSTYKTLNHMIVELLKDNWEMLRDGSVMEKKQKGKGSYHKSDDLKKYMNDGEMNWDQNIADFKRNIGWKKYV